MHPERLARMPGSGWGSLHELDELIDASAHPRWLDVVATALDVRRSLCERTTHLRGCTSALPKWRKAFRRVVFDVGWGASTSSFDAFAWDNRPDFDDTGTVLHPAAGSEDRDDVRLCKLFFLRC